MYLRSPALIGILIMLIAGTGVFVVKQTTEDSRDPDPSDLSSHLATSISTSTDSVGETSDRGDSDTGEEKTQIDKDVVDNNNPDTPTTTKEPAVEKKQGKEVAKEELESDGDEIEIDYSQYSNFIEVEDLKITKEKDIDIKAIVLIRCMYTSQYYGETAAIEEEFDFSLGSGFFVNPNGTILTAGHVVRDKTFETDDGREWSLKKCQITRTKSDTIFDGIRSTDKRFRGGEAHFEDVDIIYEPPESIYKDADGMDVAVLRLTESDGNNPFFKLVPNMVNLKTDEYGPVVVGYPGKNIMMQTIERATTFFHKVEAAENSKCKEKDFKTPCGWRYTLVRDLSDFKAFKGLVDWNMGFYTILGRESTNMRGGFSGSPTLLNGNVIGILTSGSVQSDLSFNDKGVDVMYVLTSYDIVEHLKSEGISI